MQETLGGGPRGWDGQQQDEVSGGEIGSDGGDELSGYINGTQIREKPGRKESAHRSGNKWGEKITRARPRLRKKQGCLLTWGKGGGGREMTGGKVEGWEMLGDESVPGKREKNERKGTPQQNGIDEGEERRGRRESGGSAILVLVKGDQQGTEQIRGPKPKRASQGKEKEMSQGEKSQDSTAN